MGWEATIREVGDKRVLTGGYPVHMDVTNRCGLYYVEKDEDQALSYSKGQEIVISGEINLVSQFFGDITLHLDEATVIIGESAPEAQVPTATPIPLTYMEFYDNYQGMTDLQQEEYHFEIIGTRVRWIARVEEVSEAGRIHLQGFEDSPFVWVYLDGIPIEESKTFTKGQSIEFEATVRETGTGKLGVGFAVYLDDSVLISSQ